MRFCQKYVMPYSDLKSIVYIKLQLKVELSLAQEELVKISELQKVYPAFMDVSFDQVDFEKEETDTELR